MFVYRNNVPFGMWAASFAFPRYDGNGDGELNQNEAQHFLIAVGVDAEDMPDTFQRIDTNNDMKLSHDEVKASKLEPPLALRVRTLNGTVETHAMETADFGPQFRETLGTGYSGMLKLADPIEACSPLTGVYADRIVLIDHHQGGCEFCNQAKAAQSAGARAVMIANNDETLLHMAVGTCGQDVTIPSIMIPFSVGERLKLRLYTASTVVFPICPSESPMKPGFGLEECDDGNTVSGDGCSDLCMVECGDGKMSGSEFCDDGNKQDNDGCSSMCTTEIGLYECSDPTGCNTKCGDSHVVRDGCFLSGMSSDSLHVSTSCLRAL